MNYKRILVYVMTDFAWWNELFLGTCLLHWKPIRRWTIYSLLELVCRHIMSIWLRSMSLKRLLQILRHG